MTWFAVATLILGLVTVSFSLLQTIARIEMIHDVTQDRLRILASSSLHETAIPTALEDWDVEFERRTGLKATTATPAETEMAKA